MAGQSGALFQLTPNTYRESHRTWEVMKNLSKVLESFNFRIKKESKKLEYRDLTGREKLKLFQNFNIPMLLP